MQKFKLPAIIENEINIFNKEFKNSIKSRLALLDKISHFIIKKKGKQMRPTFVLLSAKMGGDLTEKSYRGAGLVELLHTATLIHDDVVDEAYERRGFFSVNALWKNKVAVLIGDYLLSKGLLISLESKDFDILEIVSNAVKNMSEGELLQIEKSRNLNLEESIYYEIIKGKTASLISSACAVGAASTFKEKKDIDNFALFGEKVGMAFQIKDDLFDYGNTDIGKPTGNDIKEKKLTLPLIYTLNNCEKKDRKQIIYIIKNQNTVANKVKYVTDFVKEFGGLDYARKKMYEFKDQALEILYRYPKSEVRDALEYIVNYTVEREK